MWEGCVYCACEDGCVYGVVNVRFGSLGGGVVVVMSIGILCVGKLWVHVVGCVCVVLGCCEGVVCEGYGDVRMGRYVGIWGASVCEGPCACPRAVAACSGVVGTCEWLLAGTGRSI